MPTGSKRVISPVSISLPAFLITILFIFTACNKGVVFDDTKKIPENVWKQDDKLKFEVPVEDTLSRYRFFLNVRHSTAYRYSNLYLFIHSTFPGGRETRDTVECMLARPDGKWLGKGITGIRDNQLLLRTGLRFPSRGVYVFEFEQAMREENLEGIMDIGLRIERE